jgi:uncharacterized protein YjbI with pentapeptide repeats
MLREIKKSEFREKLSRGDGDFSLRVFDFSFDFSEIIKGEIGEINFDLDFSKSIFKQDISFAKTTFKKSFIISKAEINGVADFFNAKFNGNFQARYSIFSQKVNFNLARFLSDADFNRSVFLDSVHFKKVRFQRNLFLGKVMFSKKVDFSYAHFSNEYYTSFMSINKFNNNKIYGKFGPPYLIFRSIYFPKRTIFNNVDLSRTIFQDSVINGTVFKDCSFPKKDERNAFYPEIAKEVEIEIDSGLKNLKEEAANTILLPANNEVNDLNISDIIKIKEKGKNFSETFFIVTRFDGDSPAALRKILQRSNLKKIYTGFNEIICQDCTEPAMKNSKVVAFRLKKFDQKKH